jgi:glycosyltransferase involved in cell wall biosynthesis
VSIVTGVVVPRDAISNIAREQLEAVARYGRLHRRPVRVKVYACYADVPDSRVVMAPDAAAVVADEHFLASDLILYHFGIYYPLFDSIHFAPRGARTVVTYYGITHPALLHEGVRDSLYNSYRQAANLHVADRILTTSGFLTAELTRLGVPAARVTRIPLPVSFERLPDPARRQPPGETLRLAYVGRFVSAKGVLDLLRAVDLFAHRGGGPVEVDLVGSATFSDPAYLTKLREFAASLGPPGSVRFHFDVPDAELAEVLLGAEALVIPSFHEGFCVPVIEAMACGCFPICSDAGALPETSGGLGRTFPVGNADELADRLGELARARRQGGYRTDQGFVPRAEWLARARTYSLGFARACWHERFWAAVLEDLAPAGADVHAYLTAARKQVAAGLRAGTACPPVERSLYARVAEALAPPDGQPETLAS